MLTSTATIIYKNNWWIVADVDPEICRYYRWWILKNFGLELFGSRWNPHITIVRGEEPSEKSLWNEMLGEEIEFSYSHKPRRDCGLVWWHLDVTSPTMLDMRERLGLPRQPKHRLHITVGREHPTEGVSRFLWLEESGGYANSWRID